MLNDSLGERMKDYYENTRKYKLMRRVPVAIRFDGKAFHSFTKNFRKPFDYIFVDAMQQTMKYLCENIQGAVFGYCQSDEITLILVDYKNLNTCAWFDYEVQKMCSVGASMATMAFNKFFAEIVEKEEATAATIDDIKLINVLKEKYVPKKYTAMFDARVFEIPKEEVANLILWRQKDAARNSIQAVGQTYFSHNELNGKTCEEIQELLFSQKGLNWNDLPTYLKRGSACYKITYEEEETTRNRWFIDLDMPLINENRDYVEKWIKI